MLIGDNYVLEKLIGTGSFGKVYKAKSKRTGSHVAVKLVKVFYHLRRRRKQPFRHSCGTKPSYTPQFKAQVHLPTKIGVAKLHWSGTSSGYYAVVMDLLGPSVGELLSLVKGKFSLSVTAALGLQMISLLEHVHSHNFVHQDIKPKNFLFSCDMKSLYIIDFGLSKRNVAESDLGYPYCNQVKGMIGTPRYASINAHYGKKQSMRDDVESLFYVLIYLMRGKLPWQRLKVISKEERSKSIMEKKLSVSINELCIGLPGEYIEMGNYIHSLEFAEKPSYKYLKTLLINIQKRFYENFLLKKACETSTTEDSKDSSKAAEECIEEIIPSERETCALVPHFDEYLKSAIDFKTTPYEMEDCVVTERRVEPLCKLVVKK
eukprot:TRINITY_DN6184_c0_g1_i1.p1 TRINITY_DN6184_c0_g1~~TRINITY_DN6184_c0_g1_i1.p1  ORF type:complete len:375 (-),score=39.83 TRINITY_DN6184_c0_g1_i1:129-1253(-)